MCSSSMSFLRGSGSSVSTSTVRLPGCGRPVMRRMSPSPSSVHIVTGLNGAQSLQGRGIAGVVPDVPQRGVFFAKTPKGESLQTELARSAQLIEDGDGVKKPDHMALIIVLVDVLEVRIERVVVEIEIGVGVRGALPCISDVQIIGIENFRLGMAAILRIGNGKRPVVAVVSDGADDFFFGHDFENANQVADEPLLAGDGSRIAGVLVLVVVHQDNAVGVGRDGLQILVAGGYGHVDVKTKIARVHLRVERLNELKVRRLICVGEAFEVERNAAIGRVGGEEAHDLLEKGRAFVRIAEHVSDAGIPLLGVRVEVVDGGKDFGIFLGGLNDVLDLVEVVGIVHEAALDDRILAEVVAAHRHECAVGRIDMQPHGEEHVELVDVFFERGVAGRVVLHVIGGAQSFTGVQRDVRRFARSFATRGMLVLAVAFEDRWLRQSPVVVFRIGKQQFGQLLVADHVEGEADDDEGREYGDRIEDAAEALPALAFRVEKDLLIRHF